MAMNCYYINNNSFHGPPNIKSQYPGVINAFYNSIFTII